MKDILKGDMRKNGHSGETEGADHNWEEKVNQIRIYSGEKYEMVQEAKSRHGLCSNRIELYLSR